MSSHASSHTRERERKRKGEEGYLAGGVGEGCVGWWRLVEACESAGAGATLWRFSFTDAALPRESDFWNPQ